MAFEHIRRVRRSARVARTGARIYLGYKRTQRRARKLGPEEADAAWNARHESEAERLYHMAVDLKGLYIKAGQFIGTRADVVPPAYTRSLSRLQDRVPARPAAAVRASIEAELHRPVDELFARFDDTPIGAASLAQAHRALLHDGREVVVKVQYPEVAGLVKLDLRNLRTIVGIVARREPRFDFRAVVNEVGRQVPLEVDFVREAEMTRRVRANLARVSGITVPRVIDEMVARRVVVTEYLHGRRLLEAGKHPEDIDGPATAQAIADAYGHQIMVDGLFQADPHPGNILLLPGGGVGLLDFGLTKELPDAARLGFARLVMAASSRDLVGVLAAFDELGVKTASSDPDDVMALMQLFFGARPPGSPGGGLFPGRRQDNALARNPVRAIPGDLVLLGRVVGLLRGVCSSLGAPLTPMEMLRPFAERALAKEASGAAGHAL